MTNSSSKGDRRERELVDMFWEEGLGVVRAPASGSRTNHPLPDLVAYEGRLHLAIEVKASGGDPIYIDGDAVKELDEFSEAFGAISLIGARFDRQNWRFFEPVHLYETDSGNRRIREMDLENGLTFEELIE